MSVGIRTAETFVAWVDDVTRFRRTRQLGAYFGLVPCQDASADKNRLGHITRDGPPVMRKLICEAAWTVVQKMPGVQVVLRADHGGQAGAQEDRHRRHRAPADGRDAAQRQGVRRELPERITTRHEAAAARRAVKVKKKRRPAAEDKSGVELERDWTVAEPRASRP
jgi:transposase